MRVLVVYGTATGQTRKIVDFLADHWRQRSHTVEIHDAARLPRRLALTGFDRIVVASCMRQGEYRRSVVRFVQHHRDALQAVPSVFLSVSMAAANVLNHADAARWLENWDAEFFAKTGWTPPHVEHVAGALKFRHYDPITKWFMRRIAMEQGYQTDTSRDHEYTDWAALAAFADRLAGPSGAFATAA